jgi:hypothetical protein
MRSRIVRCAAVVASLACTAKAPRTAPQSQAVSETGELPSWLPGVWTRDWIERGGARTDSFDVRYLQTQRFFADARFPRDQPKLEHAASFADLTDAELLLLAQQRGFTGWTTASGLVATWHHEIDFQPPDGSDDTGRLERVDDSHMYEHGLDGSYVESWRTLGATNDRFRVVRVDAAGRLDRVLVVVGDHFIYVRNREKDLPVAESLEALIAKTRATRGQIIAYLDCEFSVGRVQGGTVPWQIEHSTLPWRAGRHLEFADSLELFP